MPRADFRSRGDSLDPLALAKLVAVMCYPADARGREGILRSGAGVLSLPRYRELDLLGSSIRSSDLPAVLSEHWEGGSLAGAVCLAMAEMSSHGRSGDPRLVFSVASDLAERWEGALSRETAIRPIARLPSRSEADLLGAFEAYRGAAHLWAAMVYGRLQQIHVAPSSLQKLPAFVAYAAEIGRLASSLHWPQDSKGLALSVDALWTFLLPVWIARNLKATLSPSSWPAKEVAPPAVEEHVGG